MKKKIIPIMLSVIFILSSFMTITAFAASPASQDGLTATLTSSKTTYAANEDIDVSLTVTNNNTYAVDGIQTAITLPDGVTAKAGSLTQNAFTLAAGESKTSTPTIIKTVTITPPKDDNNTSPKTGDSSNIAIWLTIMLVSAGALVFLAIKNKKIKSKGVLSLFLCFAILGTIGLPISANAASTQKSFTVTEDLTVDGKAVTVSAEISYGYIAHNTVTVTDGTGSDTYAEGDTVTITANAPEIGYHFTSWTVVGGDVTLANDKDITTTFTMPNKAVDVKANYEMNTYTITATSDSNGAVSPQGAITVNHGDSKKFDFTANEGYHIKDVTVDGTSVGAVPRYTFDNVTENHTISVTFEIDTFTLTATAGANGTVTPTGTTNVSYGGTQTYTITPNNGYHIVDVIVDGVSKGIVGTHTFDDVKTNHSISATFAINTYTITATTDSNGAVSPAGAITVNHGDSKRFDFNANEGYHIKDVTVDGTSVGAVPRYTFDNVTENHTISVTFEIDTFTLTATAGANGTVTPTGTTNVSYGGTQTYTITPNNGYHIVDVIVDGVSKGIVGTHTFDDVKANHSISATFAINTYTITATTDSNGAVSPQGSITVNYGDSKTYTITANDGYHIVDVLVNGESKGAITTYTFNSITANSTIYAIFAKDTYTVTVNNGTIQGGATTVAWGETVTIVADTPLAGDSFTGWTVVAGGATLSDSTQTTTTFVMPKANVEISANMVWDSKTIATAYNSGSGTQTGPYIIASGAQLAYLAQQVNAGTSYSGTYFKLSNDINLNNQEWTPIGKDETKFFAGNFDGNDKSISGMKITSGGGYSTSNIYLGLFGCIDSGTVSNLSTNGTIAPTQFERGQKHIGGVIGYLKSGSASNLSATIAITTTTCVELQSSDNVYVGGVIGKTDVTVSSISATPTISFGIDGYGKGYVGHNIGWYNNQTSTESINDNRGNSDLSITITKKGGFTKLYVNGK